MALPAILSKVKALAPVAVVGGAVAITIKLLTQESIPNSQILKVDAEEDIKTTEFEEQLEEEQPIPPEEEPQADKVEEAEEDAEQQEEEQDADGSDSSDSEEEEENKKQEKQEDEKEKPKLTFKDGGLGDILKEIFKSD